MSVVINGSTGITSPDFSGAGSSLTGVQAASGPSSSQFSLRNKIINGDMNIAQRGTSFVPMAQSTYGLDRWLYAANNDAVVNLAQQADVPSDNEFQNSLRLTVTTADTSITTSQNATISQRIEGYNARDLIGKTFTLSFWVRSSKTGTHCVALRNGAADRSYIIEYTINSANTWEKKTITVSGGLITAGTWNWTNGAGLIVDFSMAVGPTFQTTANAWQTGNFLATTNQVNCLDTIGNIFAITGVQLEKGSIATPFEHRPYGTELALCQRYYQEVFGANGGVNNNFEAGITQINFQVQMRAAPTMAEKTVFAQANTTAVSFDNVQTFGTGFYVAMTAAYWYRRSGCTASAEL